MKTPALCLVLAASTFAVGCSSGGARRVDTGGTETVTSLNKIDVQDWMDAADTMTQTLVESGVLDRGAAAKGDTPVLAISRIVNNTTERIDTDMLTKKIRVNLNRSGKALTTTVIGLGGRGEDALAQGEAERAAFFNDGDDPAVGIERPDFTLSGKIIEDRARSGNVRQTTYVFQLSLTDVKRGLAVWEDEVPITKQGKQNSVGW